MESLRQNKNNKILVVIIKGGLGNQMSQYAFSIALENIFDSYIIYRYPVYPKIFNVNIFKTVKNLINYMINKSYRFDVNNRQYELDYAFCIDMPKINFRVKNKMKRFNRLSGKDISPENFKKLSHSIILDGTWANYRYFDDYYHLIKKKFVFKKFIDERNIALSEKIKSCNSVSIHIRRGDYLFRGHLVMSLKYYSSAINIIRDKINSPYFFIFSDDIVWVKNEFEVSNSYFVDWNKDNSYNDMHLMSLCKHNIIGNSTYSWWAAYLNTNKSKIVIAPKTPSNHDGDISIYSTKWIKI